MIAAAGSKAGLQALERDRLAGEISCQGRRGLLGVLQRADGLRTLAIAGQAAEHAAILGGRSVPAAAGDRLVHPHRALERAQAQAEPLHEPGLADRGAGADHQQLEMGPGHAVYCARRIRLWA